MVFSEAVRLFHDGRMTDANFFRSTRGTWERMARYLLRRWPAPAWVDQDEIVQELHLGASLCVWSYDERLSHGRTLEDYVEWNAIDYAKKKLHAMRGAKRSGNADGNPSRIERPLSMFDATPEWVEGLLRQDATQHTQCEVFEAIGYVCRSVPNRHAIEAFLRAGDVVAGAVALYEDKELRAACGIVRPRDAGRLVANAALALAKRLDAA
jgi:hypothetical protein